MEFSLLEVSDNTIDIVFIVSVVALCLLAVIFLVLIFSKSIKNTRAIVYGAICIALSFGLSYIKLPLPFLQFGGSITLASFVPLLIYSYLFGMQRGLFAGIIYCILQFLQESWFLTPVQFILDYILAFSSIALAGSFKKLLGQKAAVITGAVAVGITRYIMHVFAGIIFFNAGYVYPEFPQSSAFLYSAVYNSVYVLPDIAIAIAVIVFLLLGGFYTRISKIIKV